MAFCGLRNARTAPPHASPRYQPVLALSPAVAAVRGRWPCNTPRFQPCQAVDVAAAVVIGFLPWRGCSQGGFYGTGVEGVHGKDCQAMYQPAAAAEARFAAAQQRLQQAAAAAARSVPEVLASEGVSSSYSSAAAGGGNSVADSSLSRTEVAEPMLTSSNSTYSRGSSNASENTSVGDGHGPTSSSNNSSDAPSTVGQPQNQQVAATAGTAAEQMRQVPESVKDLVREIMRGDNRARTKQLVDDAWQTLE